MTPSEQPTEEQIKEDLHFCLETLAQALHVPAYTPPNIYISEDEKTSFFRPADKSITITRKHAGDGIVYFEETAHFFRDKLARREEENPLEGIVQEFFGRMGESVGRQAVKGSAYERLFEGNPERNWSRMERQTEDAKTHAENVNLILKHYIAEIKTAEQLSKNTDRQTELMRQFIDGTERNHQEYEQSNDINRFFEEEKCNTITYWQKHDEIIEKENPLLPNAQIAFINIFKREVEDNLRSIRDIAQYETALLESEESLKTITDCFDDKAINNNIKEEDSFLREYPLDTKKRFLLDRYRQDVEHYRERIEHERERTIGNINKMKKTVIQIEKNKEHYDPERHVKEMGLEIQFYQAQNVEHDIHNKGYLSAEVFMKENPDYLQQAPTLFRKSNEDILLNTFNSLDLTSYQEMYQTTVIDTINQTIKAAFEASQEPLEQTN